ncbi:GGDEF domain-containing protein [Alteromonadaceae bacterium M269]|nr:GGDEF domain-containing protein [Alteromonadaceae bacterium M269]
MIKSLKSIFVAFRRSGGVVNRKGLNFIGLNLVISVAFVVFCWKYGSQELETPNYLSVTLRFLVLSTYFAMFSLIVFILLKRHIKYSVITGLFLNQLGALISLLDLFWIFKSDSLLLLRDFMYLSGGIFIAMGSTLWVVFTYKMSIQDALTKAHNRRFFEVAIEHHLKGHQNSAKGSFLLSLDIDDFKRVNDDFGHSAGDKVLKIVTKVLRTSARSNDIICRSGGEEFEVLLLNCDLSNAKAIAQRVLDNLSRNTPQNMPCLTASIGLTEIRCGDSADSARKRADDAMYQAKRTGKAKFVYQD